MIFISFIRHGCRCTMFENSLLKDSHVTYNYVVISIGYWHVLTWLLTAVQLQLFVIDYLLLDTYAVLTSLKGRIRRTILPTIIAYDTLTL